MAVRLAKLLEIGSNAMESRVIRLAQLGKSALEASACVLVQQVRNWKNDESRFLATRSEQCLDPVVVPRGSIAIHDAVRLRKE